jgi:hypothetical protein
MPPARDTVCTGAHAGAHAKGKLMRNTIKLGLSALLAAILLASALSTASARNLEVSNQRFRVRWSRLEFRSGFVTIRCQVTLEGSFHSRTFAKIERTLVGAITRIDVFEERCTGGIARAERPPPWHVTYEGFTGILPNIQTIRLLMQRFQFLVESIGVRCKYGTSTDNVTGSAAVNAAGEVTTLQPLAPRNIATLLEGGGLCSATGSLVSNPEDGIVTLLNSTARITVRLI